MPARPTVANFLQGLFVMLMCALFGGLLALLFHWGGGRAWGAVAVCGLIPIAGAVKTRQRDLLAGLLVGAGVSVLFYFALRPHP